MKPENINPYFGPLVEELSSEVTILGYRVCGILSCTTNDIPAARKVCGFAGYSARLACTRCLESFPTSIFGEKPDFSGFDCDNWPSRNDEDVHRDGIKYLQAKAKSERKTLIRENGCRISLLQDLPHFSVVSHRPNAHPFSRNGKACIS